MSDRDDADIQVKAAGMSHNVQKLVADDALDFEEHASVQRAVDADDDRAGVADMSEPMRSLEKSNMVRFLTTGRKGNDHQLSLWVLAHSLNDDSGPVS